MSYSPLPFAGEKINLGIVLYDEHRNLRGFRYTDKLDRLSDCDEEVDSNVVKCILQDIKDDIDGSLTTDENFDVEQYIRYYVNDFSFDLPKVIEYEDFEETFEELFKSIILNQE
ncbi:MAG: DUF3037 domain-containing protein [Anaerovoracaceae bacterium]